MSDIRPTHDPKAVRLAKEYQALSPDQKRSFDRLNLNPEELPESDAQLATVETSGPELPEPDTQPAAVETGCPELPAWAQVQAEPVACPWLDEYIEYSRTWAPRGYDPFHEATGLFILSTVAARRVRVHFGRARYPSLYLGMVARSSLSTKSTVAEIAIDLLRRAGLGYLLAPDNATPQSFLARLVRRIPENFDQKTTEEQQVIVFRLGFAGQKGWFFGEFGQQIRAMMRDSGPLADFRGLLRIFDDGNEDYTNSTIGRGDDIVCLPYLTLLVALTPDDLRPFARRGAALWGDGFLARFALIAPPEGLCSYGRFPTGERQPPANLLDQLQEWHQRLGIPTVEIEVVAGEDDQPGYKQLKVSPFPQTTLSLASGVEDAFYAYHDALLEIARTSENPDLDGNYARFAEKALRIAILLASINNAPQITLAHWARAQQITERWREGLHELYRQLNAPTKTEEQDREDRVLRFIEHKGPVTLREIKQNVRMAYGELDDTVHRLVRAGIVEAVPSGKTTRYQIIP